MIRVSALYPNAQGSRFDAQYYVERHEPFARDMLAPFGLGEIRTVIGLCTLDDAPPAFWAISEMTFATRDQFDAAMNQCGERLFADLPNYTDVAPVLQISRLGSDAES